MLGDCKTFCLTKDKFMKKTFLLLVIALSVLPIFASKNNVDVKLAPYALQVATSKKEGSDPVLSTYGFGADISYQRDLTERLFLEGGLSWNTYKLKDRNPLSSIMPYAGIGYNLLLNDKWKVITHVDLGIDWLIYDSVKAATFTLKGGIGAAMKLNEKLSATLGVDATFGFSKKDGTSYVNYRVIPTLGLGVAF